MLDFIHIAWLFLYLLYVDGFYTLCAVTRLITACFYLAAYSYAGI